MTKFPDLFAALAAPFDSNEVMTLDGRRGKDGKPIRYVTAPTVMNRLDEVLGPENWWTEYTPRQRSVECRITVRLPDGSLLSKVDAGGYAGMADEGDDDKSGYSDALKRAAMTLGVGRYLWRVRVPQHGADAAAELPPPATEVTRPAGTPERPSSPSPSPGPAPSVPGPGGFYGWVKDKGAAHGVNLANYLNKWGERRGYPPRLKDWNKDQVVAGIHEAERKLATIAGDAREPELVGAGAGASRNGYHRNGQGRG